MVGMYTICLYYRWKSAHTINYSNKDTDCLLVNSYQQFRYAKQPTIAKVAGNSSNRMYRNKDR